MTCESRDCAQSLVSDPSYTVQTHAEMCTEREFRKPCVLKKLVDVAGIEPATPCLQSARVASNKRLAHLAGKNKEIAVLHAGLDWLNPRFIPMTPHSRQPNS
jgi:hypothetical protein